MKKSLIDYQRSEMRSPTVNAKLFSVTIFLTVVSAAILVFSVVLSQLAWMKFLDSLIAAGYIGNLQILGFLLTCAACVSACIPMAMNRTRIDKQSLILLVGNMMLGLGHFGVMSIVPG